MRAEVEHRYGDRAAIVYLDTTDPLVLEDRTDIVHEIQKRGLVYPVTVIDGRPVWDGAVSYPAMMRAINDRVSGHAGEGESP